MRVVLEVIKSVNTDVVGKNLVFDGCGMYIVGRPAKDGSNRGVQSLIPGDPHLSRGHMMIMVTPQQVLLRDISRFGTTVNGQKVTETKLKDGDVLRGGKTKFRVRLESMPDKAAGAGEAGSSDALDDLWKTKSSDHWPPVGGEKVRCLVCGELAENTPLSDLTETSLIAYVCPTCRAKQPDPQCPIPHYEKLATLGRGTLGPVFKARRKSTGKLAVVKVLAPEMCVIPNAVKTFLRQMRLAAQLTHPNIVPVVEMGQSGDQLWLASEYVDGVDARKLRQQLQGRLPLPDAVDIICQTLAGLQYAHSLNLVHRDVKPSNMLITGQPGKYVARLTDFGLIKNINEAGISQSRGEATGEGETRGTVPFMPPEQVSDCRFVKPQGDIYGAAASLYWLLTGEFVRNFAARDRRGDVKNPYLVILEDPIVPLRRRKPAISEAMARVVERALADDPEDRFETAAEMATALRDAIE